MTNRTHRLAAKQEERDRAQLMSIAQRGGSHHHRDYDEVNDDNNDDEGDEDEADGMVNSCSKEVSLNVLTTTTAAAGDSASSLSRDKVITTLRLPLTGTDLMHARATLKNHRHAQLRDKWLSEELNDCTFTPRISARARQQQQQGRKVFNDTDGGGSSKSSCTLRDRSKNDMRTTIITSSDASANNRNSIVNGTMHESSDDGNSNDNNINDDDNSKSLHDIDDNDNLNVFDRLHRLAREKQQQQQQLKINGESTTAVAVVSSSASQPLHRPQLHHSFAHTALPPFTTSSNSRSCGYSHVDDIMTDVDNNELNKSSDGDIEHSSTANNNRIDNSDNRELLTSSSTTTPAVVPIIHDIKSVSSFLQRLEQGRQKALTHRQRAEAVYHYDDVTYQRSRVSALRGAVPFQFNNTTTATTTSKNRYGHLLRHDNKLQEQKQQLGKQSQEPSSSVLSSTSKQQELSFMVDAITKNSNHLPLLHHLPLLYHPLLLRLL